jgi:putative glutamine amidotransferase
VAEPVVILPAYHLAAGRVSRWAAGGFGVPETYVAALRRAGVQPVIVPSDGPLPEGQLGRFDGVVLVGGGDIDPARYDAERHPAVYGVEPRRDELELGLARTAVEAGMPVLAVCRGLQVLNVAFGGTLHQHLPDRAGGLGHGEPAAGGPGLHSVRVAPGTRIAAACGGPVLEACTSHHHQGVDRIGAGLVATGWSEDGLVEVLETPDAGPWVLGVQWHPEMTADRDPVQQALFDAFAAVVSA